jgi:predicted transcriptional regulator of viral defense system
LLLQTLSLVSYIAVVARSSTLSRLGGIAEEQWGLVTRRQAESVAGIATATFARLASDGSILERVAHGVYHLTGAPLPDHLDLRAAWLQLAPEIPAWERQPSQGVVSHRSAAALYGIGHLPADGHDFTLPRRRQSRRAEVRLHRRQLEDRGWIDLRGLPVTRPSRIASDLLYDREDPEAVAHLIADAIRAAYDYPGAFADALASHAARFGLRQGDGLGLLRWVLDLVGDPETSRWMGEARAHADRDRADQAGLRGPAQ